MRKAPVHPIIKKLNAITDDGATSPEDRMKELYYIASYAVARAGELGDYYYVFHTLRSLYVTAPDSIPKREGKMPVDLPFEDDQWAQQRLHGRGSETGVQP